MQPRKLILSRKGFDTSSGGCPSPIFPNNTIYSLPIPGGDEEDSIRYEDLSLGPIDMGQMVEDLTGGQIRAHDAAHLDPDIRGNALSRDERWRPMFGQAGASQTHLENQGVGLGDLFLFFGLFRKVEKGPNGWRFVQGSRPQHLIWGWMQIGEVCKVDEIIYDKEWEWALYHCHFSFPEDPSNTLYVASEGLDLGVPVPKSGAGVYSRDDSKRVLTAPGQSVSHWRLPSWFYPEGGKTPLSYHPDMSRWKREGNYSFLRSVGRGQEFVLDMEQYPEGLQWALDLVRD